jgi:regulator of protease activity HflC (stomatin/prohibitin superfamily)
MALLSFPIILVFLFVLFLLNGVKILKEYERAVIFRLGRVSQALVGESGPGLIILIPGIDKMVKVPLRTVAMEVSPQDIITRDNVSVKVSAVIYFRVIDPQKAILQVENYLHATSQMAQTTLRSVLGQNLLDDLLSKREEINLGLQRIIDQQTEPWGVKVANVEVKNVDLPPEMMRAIAKQAEAERERRAKVIHAEGEFQASQKLADAGGVIAQNPIALQLRYFQTLTEIAVEKNSTIIFPIPLEFLEPFLKSKKKENS